MLTMIAGWLSSVGGLALGFLIRHYAGRALELVIWLWQAYQAKSLADRIGRENLEIYENSLKAGKPDDLAKAGADLLSGHDSHHS